MNEQALIALIRAEGLERVGKAVNSVPEMVREGWDLTQWYTKTAPGAVLFYRQNHPGESGVVTSETRVLVVNAAETERRKWEKIAHESKDRTLVVMAPGGRVREGVRLSRRA